jgi:protocatechuate 3,4-dioxygenase beta subunit
MERKEFLKMGLSSLGMMTIAPILVACKTIANDTLNPTTDNISTKGSTNGNSASDCSVNPTETEGPFPTHSPTSYVIKDIKAGSKGVNMTANISIKNKNMGCGALQGAIVDIWHCDADGNYSEYGSLTSSHFLRGRQTADANGLVSFDTIFPGWYNGRAVHIHVHVYSATGKSLLVTQIAFPPAACDTVFTTATSFYKKGKADTSNDRDGIFSDGYTTQLGNISGNITDGMVLTHNIVVNA